MHMLSMFAFVLLWQGWNRVLAKQSIASLPPSSSQQKSTLRRSIEFSTSSIHVLSLIPIFLWFLLPLVPFVRHKDKSVNICCLGSHLTLPFFYGKNLGKLQEFSKLQIFFKKKRSHKFTSVFSWRWHGILYGNCLESAHWTLHLQWLPFLPFTLLGKCLPPFSLFRTLSCIIWQMMQQ